MLRKNAKNTCHCFIKRDGAIMDLVLESQTSLCLDNRERKHKVDGNITTLAISLSSQTLRENIKNIKKVV